MAEQRTHFCRELTNREWDRLVDKDMQGAVALSCRMDMRKRLLEEGAKRVPKHRKNKRGPEYP